ncbi:hypothetical protein CWS43_13985 [Rahnella sp. AA]|uniref:hypothetical protein n=1 Tax=Rahnella sp. AA TaxID=2057180 RepID=UPI000C3309EE|nr:hypothetical protein [Rahnella sp. AA]PKE29852.1 hypothetical protein CWS43_13985 [Rahnella sp. AA]
MRFFERIITASAYLLAFTILMIVFMETINNIVTSEQIQHLAGLLGVHGIDDILDWYINISAMVSVFFTVSILLIYRRYAQRKKTFK